MRCASCDGELPRNARFCPFCGSSAGPAATAVPVEERKVVTVVFCDLVGSTALSGVLDPETLRTVVLRYFALMRERLEEFGGTVEKFIGDAVMAVFGVPVTHEDDAARALAAALGMLDAVRELNETELRPSLGISLSVRIGVNTGPAVTTTDVSTRQALVSGETVNIAARFEQHAGEGEILIGPETRRAAGAAARTEPVGPLQLKGKEQPVTAYRLLGVVEDDPETSRRFDVPFVGRECELAVLRETLNGLAGAGGTGLLTVLGEAGMGKTRLIHEWRGGTDQTFGYGAGRCRPYGEHGSLAPLADAVRQLLAAFPDMAEPKAGSEAGEALAVLSAGLLEDGTPSPSADDTCVAAAGLLAALARRRPIVLVVDDCQWASDPLLDMLGTLAGELASRAVLFICLARPDLLDRRPDWGTGRAWSRSLTLPGLTTAEAGAVADALTEAGAYGENGLPVADRRTRPAVPAHVLESAGGNPFYLEQLIAALAQPDADSRPDGAESLPTTLQALLGARISALGRAERTALDLAAVVGREFTSDDVSALAAEDRESEPGGALYRGGDVNDGRTDGQRGPDIRTALAKLGRHRLVSTAETRDRGMCALRFSSGLIHEVTYQSMAKRVRAERHVRAAGILAARLASTVGGHERGKGGAAVARHLERAYRYRTELGIADEATDRLRRDAARLLTESGSQALARSDLAWAGGLLARAVDLSAEGEPEWSAAARRLGEVRLATGQVDEGRSLLLAVLASGGADRTPEPVEAAHARLALAVASAEPGKSTAGEVAHDTLPVFERAGDDLGQARACIRMAQERQLHGRHVQADALLTRGLGHALRSGAEPERALALGAIGVSLWRGPEPVPMAVSRSRALLAEHGDRRPTVRLTLNCPLAVLLALQERWDDAAACLARAGRLAGELGYAEGTVVLPLFTAEVETLAGNSERALALLDEAAKAARALKAGGLLGTLARESARLLVDAGRIGEAAERLAATVPAEADCTGGLPAADAGLARSDAADLDGLLGRIAVARGEPERAAGLSARAVESAAGTDSPVVQAIAWLDRADVLRRSGLPQEAHEAAVQAGRRFEAKGHLPGARRAAEFTAAPVSPTEPHGNPKGC